MADLKIKAGAGSTNKLLIQSQDQANNDYAIQIGDAGATTLTNATLTNATMSAGTIGSGVTFPAGHMLQTIGDTDTGTSRATSSSNYSDITGLSCAITIAKNNSKILIHAHSGMTYPNSDTLRINIKRVITGGDTVNEIVSGSYGWIEKRGSVWGNTSGFWLDSPAQNAGTVITYSLRFKNDNNSTGVYWSHADALSSLIVQEIGV